MCTRGTGAGVDVCLIVMLCLCQTGERDRFATVRHGEQHGAGLRA